MEKEHQEQSLKEIQLISQRILQKLSIFQQFEYTELFKQQFSKFASDYQKKIQRSQLQHLKQPYKLKLMFKTDPKVEKKQSLPQQEQKPKKIKFSDPNVFQYTFQLPCTYSQYQQIIKSQQIQKKVDQIITSYQVLKQILKTENLHVQLIYLSYKRVMIIAPRQFIYIRIFYEDQFNSSTHWIFTFSVPYQHKSDKTRAEVIFTAQKISQNQNQKNIQIKVYSEVDMKTAVKSDLAKSKGFVQIKKYIQKLHDFSVQAFKNE